MKLSSRVYEISDSITLKLNAKAVALAEEGKEIFNFTAGQLPFRPKPELIDLIRSECDFLKSFQYSPVAGYPELRKKLIHHFEDSRSVSFGDADIDCIVSNGGKHSLMNILYGLIDPGDEVIMFSPYWVSYPEMVKLCRGESIIVETTPYDAFIPSIDELKRKISSRTKVIIINSPNNPTGSHYSDKWMDEFAEVIKQNPDVTVISDEIYYQLSFYDPKPTYFYQKHPELLERTVIVDGISKSLACTGLRLGWTIGPTHLIKALTKLQGQTTSGANSLIQRSLIHFNFAHIDSFLEHIKKHLRENAEVLGSFMREHGLGHTFYQPKSAFYYLIDFSQTLKLKQLKDSDDKEKDDYGFQMCEELLEKHGVALVPGIAFGMPNTARMSLVLEKEDFKKGVEKLLTYLMDSEEA